MKVDSQKNCSFSFFPPLANSFIIYGKSGYAGSPKIQMGTGGSPSMIILLQSGTTASLKIAFNLEFENIRASCTLPRHFITTSKKTVAVICCCLNIECVFSFPIDKVSCVK